MIRDINISWCLNGWIVRVGCQTIVFTNAANLVESLQRYLNGPAKEEKFWREGSINAKYTLNQPLDPSQGGWTPPVEMSMDATPSNPVPTNTL